MVFCPLYGPGLTTIHDHWEDHSLDDNDLCWQSNVSAFNTLSRFVIAFLPRSNHILILWLQSSSAVILESKRRKSVITSTFSPSICHAVMRPYAMILVFLIFSCKLALSLSSTPSSRSSLVPLHFLPLKQYHPPI